MPHEFVQAECSKQARKCGRLTSVLNLGHITEYERSLATLRTEISMLYARLLEWLGDGANGVFG